MLKESKITIKDLKIKTGVVKRTTKEYQMYQQEEILQKQRIQNLEEKGADIHDINKQNQVLMETVLMIPDCKKRLEKALLELSTMTVKYY
jgi:tubulin-specific chaperone A